MGPTALVSDDLATGRLVTPFPEIEPARPHVLCLPAAARADQSCQHSVLRVAGEPGRQVSRDPELTWVLGRQPAAPPSVIDRRAPPDQRYLVIKVPDP